MIKSDLPIVDPSAWEQDQAPLDRRNAGHVKSKSRADMWYEAWYEPFSLFRKCEMWPFLLVAGEGLGPTTQKTSTSTTNGYLREANVHGVCDTADFEADITWALPLPSTDPRRLRITASTTPGIRETKSISISSLGFPKRPDREAKCQPRHSQSQL